MATAPASLAERLIYLKKIRGVSCVMHILFFKSNFYIIT